MLQYSLPHFAGGFTYVHHLNSPRLYPVCEAYFDSHPMGLHKLTLNKRQTDFRIIQLDFNSLALQEG